MANLLATCATNYGSSTQCWSSSDMKAGNFWVCSGADSFKLDQGGSVFDIWVSDSSISHVPRNILRACNSGTCIVLGQGCNANNNANIPVYICNKVQSPIVCATSCFAGNLISGTGSTCDHGSITITGSKGGYGGIFSCGWTWMANVGSSGVSGFYDSVNEQWGLYSRRTCEARLFYNGGDRFYTTTYGTCSAGHLCAADCLKSPIICATTCIQTNILRNHTGNPYFNVYSGCTAPGGIYLRACDGTARGYVYFDGTSNFGLLNCSGQWALRILGNHSSGDMYTCHPLCAATCVRSPIVCATSCVRTGMLCAHGCSTLGSNGSPQVAGGERVVLRGYSTQYDSGGSGCRLSSSGFLEFWSCGQWTGSERRWAMTNAYCMGSGACSGNLAFLLGGYQVSPVLGNNGALGTGTSIAMYITRDKYFCVFGCIESPIICATSCVVTGVSHSNVICSGNIIQIKTTGSKAFRIYGSGSTSTYTTTFSQGSSGGHNVYIPTGCFCAPILCGTNCVKSAMLCSTAIGKADTCLYSPVLCAGNRVNTPYVCVNEQAEVRPFSTNGLRGIQLRSGCTSNVSALEFTNNAGTWLMTQYVSGDNYGFLDASWGDWDIKKTKNGSMYIWTGSSGFFCNMEGAVFAATCHQAPIICGTTCMTSPRLKAITGSNQINIGQWDGSRHRIEGDAWGPLFITSYQGGIFFGISGSCHLALTAACLCSANIICANTSVKSPIICGTTCVTTSKLRATGITGTADPVLCIQNGSGSHSGPAIRICAANSGNTICTTGTLGSGCFYVSSSYNANPIVCTTGILTSPKLCLAGDMSGDMANGVTLGRTGGLPQALWGESGSKTGRIEIGLPTSDGEGNSNHHGMVHVAIDVYEYNSNNASTIIVGGHNWGCRWYNYGGHITGGCSDKSIKLAYHTCGGSGCNGRYVILLGEPGSTWCYGSVHVRSITNGAFYCSAMNMCTPWYLKRVTCADSYYNCTSADLRTNSRSMAGYQCAMTCLHTPRVCATTCLRSANVCATTAVYSPIVCATSCAKLNEVKLGDAVNLSQFNGTGTRLKICGTGDNSMYIGPNNDDSWGYIYSTNNSAGIYFGLNQGNFQFDTGHLGSYTNQEVDIGYPSHQFRCGSFSCNIDGKRICGTGCVVTPIVFPTSCLMFDQSGTRSWKICAGSGRLDILSGDDAGKVYFQDRVVVNGTDDNSGKSDLTVHTGGTAAMALSGGAFKVGAADVNWSVAVRADGQFQTYGQNLTIGTSYSGNIYLNPVGGVNCAYGCLSSPILCATNYARVNGCMLFDQNYGHGAYGLYHSARYQHVWSMGTAYKLNVNGTDSGNLYGLSWTHTNVGGQSKAGLSHQLLIMHDGTTKSAIGVGMWTCGVSCAEACFKSAVVCATTGFYGSGANLTSLNASNISSGTIATARLPVITATVGGVLSNADAVKFAGIATGAQANVGVQFNGAFGGLNFGGGYVSHWMGTPYNHIPANGTSGQFLGYSASGTAAWVNSITVLCGTTCVRSAVVCATTGFYGSGANLTNLPAGGIDGCSDAQCTTRLGTSAFRGAVCNCHAGGVAIGYHAACSTCANTGAIAIGRFVARCGNLTSGTIIIGSYGAHCATRSNASGYIDGVFIGEDVAYEMGDYWYSPGNVIVGKRAGKCITSAQYATGVGEGVMSGWNTYGTRGRYCFTVDIGQAAGRYACPLSMCSVHVGSGASTGNYSACVNGHLNCYVGNTMIGFEAGNLNRQGHCNTFVGHKAGRNNRNGCNNIMIGNEACASGCDYSNCIVIGNGSITNGVMCASCFSFSGTLSKSAGSFRIVHPNPALKKTKELWHSFVESPNEGDNLYRYSVDVENCRNVIELPDYYQYLNKNDMVWVSPVGHFGAAYASVTEDQKCAVVCTNADGCYNVLIIGTRKDIAATAAWKGTERDSEEAKHILV